MLTFGFWIMIWYDDPQFYRSYMGWYLGEHHNITGKILLLNHPFMHQLPDLVVIMFHGLIVISDFLFSKIPSASKELKSIVVMFIEWLIMWCSGINFPLSPFLAIWLDSVTGEEKIYTPLIFHLWIFYFKKLKPEAASDSRARMKINLYLGQLGDAFS